MAKTAAARHQPVPRTTARPVSRPVAKRPRRRSGMLGRHLVTALVAALLVLGFWLSRPRWVPEMRLWKAVGDASLVLLVASLLAGPLARLWRPATPLLRWRREAGIWFALLACLHAVLILNGWVRWSFTRFLGYEFVPQLGRNVRLESGFALANIVGMLALAWAMVLAATSSDRAVRRLGRPSWKWLHNGAYVVFYLAFVHAGYFLFQHFTFSFHKTAPPPDWFRLPFLGAAVAVIGLQVAAFAKTVRRD